MSKKSAVIVKLIEQCQGRGSDAHYLGYFECFNRQLYFEAHEVLEELWLQDRHGPNGAFYKGLIQLAGAFVHLQKDRPGPAGALFKLAESNLRGYPAVHERLEVHRLLAAIQGWRQELERLQFKANPFLSRAAPHLELNPGAKPFG